MNTFLIKPELYDFEIIKDKLMMKLVNYDKNKESLKSIPHFSFLDLSIIFYCQMIEKTDETLCATITNKNIDSWGITKDALYRVAVKNTRCKLGIKIIRLDEMIVELLKDDKSDFMNEDIKYEVSKNIEDHSGNSKVFVMTNNHHINGAICMLYKELGVFADQIDDDIYIIPSSIHEVLLIPKSSGFAKDDLKGILRSVNNNELDPLEYLSDNIYTYNRSEKRIIF